jgi:mono/diheme cytochrome c family protein
MRNGSAIIFLISLAAVSLVGAAIARDVSPQPGAWWQHGALSRGAALYAQHCASCHGDTGHGDGPAAANLVPHPADLAWISALPMGQWDAFMYWTIAEGGVRFGTVMPSFKASLSKNDIWSIIAYVQSQLPQRGHAGARPAPGRGR